MSDEEKKFKNVEIKGGDPRMRFRNSQDPLYVAYDYLERQSISNLFISFIKEKLAYLKNILSKKKR